MKKVFLIMLAAIGWFCSTAQTKTNKATTITSINVSTGVGIGQFQQDPTWNISGFGGPVTYQQPYAFGAWIPTPISPTGAQWINPTPTQFNNIPGLYSFERIFTVPPSTGSFACNFSVAYDDNLDGWLSTPPSEHIELVGPGNTPVITIPVTRSVSPTGYYLSSLINTVVKCPAQGEWKIRAKVNYYDNIGGFLLSGTVDLDNTPCCDTSCHISLIAGGTTGGPYVCGSTINMKCNTTYDLNPQLTCTGGLGTAITNVTIKDGNNLTPFWANAFVAGNGNGTLVIPNGISGNFTLTYNYGINGVTCSSCTYTLNITCNKPACCTFTNSVKTGNATTDLKCGKTYTLTCNSTNKFSPVLSNCSSLNIHLNTVQFLDAATLLTPYWVSAGFLSNLGSGNLVIPPNITGTFTLKYIWGENCTKCDSCSYTIKVTCAVPCTLAVNAGTDIVTCCASAGSHLNAVASGGTPGYTYAWSPGTGLNNTSIANPISTSVGTYTVTVTDAAGCVATDQVTITSGGVNCCRIAGDNNKAQVFPNPFNDGFTIKMPVNTVADLQVVNLYGMPLEVKRKASGDVQMGSKLAYGAYTVMVIYSDGSKEEIKVIKSPR